MSHIPVEEVDFAASFSGPLELDPSLDSEMVRKRNFGAISNFSSARGTLAAKKSKPDEVVNMSSAVPIEVEVAPLKPVPEEKKPEETIVVLDDEADVPPIKEAKAVDEGAVYERETGSLNVNNSSIERFAGAFYDIPQRYVSPSVREKYIVAQPSSSSYFGDVLEESPAVRAQNWALKATACFGVPDSLDKDPNRIAQYHLMEVCLSFFYEMISFLSLYHYIFTSCPSDRRLFVTRLWLRS